MRGAVGWTAVLVLVLCGFAGAASGADAKEDPLADFVNTLETTDIAMRNAAIRQAIRCFFTLSNMPLWATITAVVGAVITAAGVVSILVGASKVVRARRANSVEGRALLPDGEGKKQPHPAIIGGVILVILGLTTMLTILGIVLNMVDPAHMAALQTSAAAATRAP